MGKISKKKESEEKNWYLEKRGTYGNLYYVLPRIFILVGLQCVGIWTVMIVIGERHPAARLIHAFNALFLFLIIFKIRNKTPFFEDYLGIRNEMKSIARFGVTLFFFF